MQRSPKLSLLLLLCLLWAVLSASTETFLLVSGVAAILIVMALHQRLLRFAGQPRATTHRISLWRLPGFVLWLLLAIVQANLRVMCMAVKPGKLRSAARMIRVPASQHSEAARVLHANAITLTPGTVSVAIDHDSILVHSLFGEDQDLLAGKLDRRICKLERPA